MASFAARGVPNKDLTVWLNGARPYSRYISKYIRIIIAESYISVIQFGNKTVQRWNMPGSFAREIILVPFLKPMAN